MSDALGLGGMFAGGFAIVICIVAFVLFIIYVF